MRSDGRGVRGEGRRGEGRGMIGAGPATGDGSARTSTCRGVAARSRRHRHRCRRWAGPWPGTRLHSGTRKHQCLRAGFQYERRSADCCRRIRLGEWAGARVVLRWHAPFHVDVPGARRRAPHKMHSSSEQARSQMESFGFVPGLRRGGCLCPCQSTRPLPLDSFLPSSLTSLKSEPAGPNWRKRSWAPSGKRPSRIVS